MREVGKVMSEPDLNDCVLCLDSKFLGHIKFVGLTSWKYQGIIMGYNLITPYCCSQCFLLAY